MKRYLDLVPISAKVHKKQSKMTRVCILLAVFLVTVIFGMADMEIQSQKIQEIQNNGGWHVMFRSINEEQAALIGARPEILNASRYGTTNYTLDMGYCLEGTEAVICGFDESFTKMFPAAEIIEGAFPFNHNEVVLTQSAKDRLGVQVGDTILLATPEQQPLSLTITGFTGDTSMLAKEDAFGVFLNTSTYVEQILKNTQAQDWTYYVEFSPKCRINQVIADIQEQLGLWDKQIQMHTTLLGLIGQSNDSYMLSLYVAAVILAILVVIAGILMIASSLNSNVVQRTQFFGMLRCLGATKKQIVRIVRLEALNWCKTAIPIGVISGTVITWGLCAMLKIASPGYFATMPVFLISWPAIIAGATIGIITVLLASRSPAKRAAKVSPLTAVSGNVDSVQFTRKAANTHIFSIETALGIHHAKSSKKNLILMVGSFALSIILFLAFTSAIDFMNHALKPLQPYTPDISIASVDNTCSVSSQLPEKIMENSSVKRVYGRMFAYHVPISVDGQERIIDLISYEKNQFQWAEDQFLEGDFNAVENGSGVFIIYDPQNPLQLGSTMRVDMGNGPSQLPISGVLSTCPFDSVDGVETVICSEELFKALTGITDYTIVDVQLKSKATDKDVEEIRNLAGENVNLSDQRLRNSEVKGAYYSMALFIYGFLIVIALIAILNIVNSIAMSVTARLKQYGAMRAIGMSNRQVIKMIAAETLTYVLFGIVAGCLIGLPINKFIFERLVTSHWGDAWFLPFVPLVAIVFIVVLSAVLAVRGPAKKISNMSIVDTIGCQ